VTKKAATPPPVPPPRTKRARTNRSKSLHDETLRDVLPPAPAPAPPASPTASIDIVIDETAPEVEQPPLPVLRVAICETHGYLASARTAVTACGHTVALGGGGADGADQVIALFRRDNVDVVIVALPGPATPFDATPLVTAALALAPRRPILIGIVTGTAVEAVRRGHAAGVDLVAVRPHDPERLAPVLLAAARLGAAREAETNARGAETVLRGRLDQVARGEPGGLQPVELFQRAFETEIKRARRHEYPLAVAMFAVDVPPPPPPSGVRGILRARAGTAIVRSIRDIDVATQLDHERFLVLLPYTVVAGAAQLARRIIAAVSAGDPVAAGGRVFPPRVVAAVAGAAPGQQLGFSKLVRDASRALEQARRDGVELGIQEASDVVTR
jgi:hypothetical protein